jgi:hypothetical protein
VHIDWATLGTIAVVAAAAALTTVLLVAFAVVELSPRSARPGIDGVDDGGATRAHPAVGTALAVLSLVAAGLIVSYGLYLIMA